MSKKETIDALINRLKKDGIKIDWCVKFTNLKEG